MKAAENAVAPAKQAALSALEKAEDVVDVRRLRRC